MRDRVWVTKDNRKMLVAEMATQHIIYSIAWVHSTGKRRHLLPRLEIELEVRALKSYNNQLWG